MLRLGMRAARDIWWFFLVVLIANLVLTGLGIAHSAANEAAVRRSLRVLSLTNSLLSATIDTETAVRGFVIGNKEPFLEPFQDAQPRLEPLLGELADVVRDNEQQRNQVAELRPAIQARIEMLQQVIAEQRRIDRDTQKQMLLVEAGKVVMDDIRSKISAIEQEERRLLDENETSAKNALTATIITAIVGGLLSIATLIVLNWMIRSDKETRRRSDINIRQSEERFRLVAETLPQIVWITAPDGYCEFFNQRWYSYTGMNPAKSLGFGWTDPLHPEDLRRTESHWRKSLKSGERYEIEYRLKNAAGNYRWFLARGLPQHDVAGRILKWFGTCTDIDDQIRAQENLERQVQSRTSELQSVVDDLNAEIAERELAAAQLQASTMELHRSNRELEQFAYAASHDLQEPLRKIQAFGDRLASKFADQLTGDGRDYVQRMQSSARRMQQLIDDLLTFSRISTRKKIIVPVDLNKTVEEVLVDLELRLDQTGGEVEFDGLPTIKADALQMRQLFQNLLSNALKFHRPNTPPRITIRSTPLARMPGEPRSGEGRAGVHIEVADNGIGFDPAYANRIFQIFQRLHGRSEYEGTGVGLAVVRKIVEQHHGAIEAQSAPGEGATFRIDLPVDSTESSDDGIHDGSTIA